MTPRTLGRRIRLCIGAVWLVPLGAAAAPEPPGSIAEYMMQVHSPPDEYYFFEDDRKEVADYKSDRLVRICTGDSRHLVPIEVHYDGESALVHANDCMRVEAKEIRLEPAEALEGNAVIKVDVQTMD